MDMTQQILPFLPEAVLLSAIPLFLFFSLFVHRSAIQKSIVVMIITTALSISLIQFGQYEGTFFYKTVILDRITEIARLLILIMALLSISVFLLSGQTENHSVPEVSALFFGATAGAVFMTATRHLLMIYLSVEFVSVLSYLMVSLKSRGGESYEAAAKYLIYGAVSSGIFLFGAVNLYGLTGSLSVSDAYFALSYGPAEQKMLLIASLVLLVCGLAYKIAVLPFHAWCPDVYEGGTTPVVVFLNVSKIAGFILIARILQSFYPYGMTEETLRSGIALIGVATMTYGNIAAIRQKSIKRLLAYSSIAHAGYLFSLFSIWTEREYPTLLYYLFAYMFMNGGAFFVAGTVTGTGSSGVERFSGLARSGGSGAFWALLITAHMFSLIGLPPFTGFIAKYYLLSSLVGSGAFPVALAVLINTLISVYYYLRIVRTMYFDGSTNDTGDVTTGRRSALIGAFFGIANLIPGLAPSILPLSFFAG